MNNKQYYVHPPSQKTADVSPRMNAKKFLLRRDFAPDEAWGEDTQGVSPWELHILTNYTNTVLYTGITNNLIRRVWEHKNKFVSGFTSKYKLDKLVYYEILNESYEAISREKQIKEGSRKKKLNLI